MLERGDSGPRRALAAAALLLGGCMTIGDPPAAINAPPDGAPPDAIAAPSPDATPAPDARPACVEGDAQVQDAASGHCYVLFRTTKKAWADAQADCVAIGAHLVFSESQAENDLFTQIAVAASGSGLEDVWTGGTDAATEGTWLFTDGSPVAFTNWRSGEPNNGNGGTPENCSIVETNTAGSWDDRACANLYPYMCERE